MNEKFITERNQLYFFAIIPVTGKKEVCAFWKMRGISLLGLAIDMALSVHRIERIVLVTNGPMNFEEKAEHPRIHLLEIGNSGQTPDLTSSLFSILPQVVEKLGQISTRKPCCEGLVILDPLCPLRKSGHIQNAIELYESQGNKPRPWLSVKTVNLVPNHYHPKKILMLTQEGDLDHFDPEGQMIYRRQQLEGDDFYCINQAVHIVDPVSLETQSLEYDEILGLIIDDPMVVIEEKEDLDLAQAFSMYVMSDQIEPGS